MRRAYGMRQEIISGVMDAAYSCVESFRRMMKSRLDTVGIIGRNSHRNKSAQPGTMSIGIRFPVFMHAAVLPGRSSTSDVEQAVC